MSEHPYLQWPVFRRSIVAAFDRSLTQIFFDTGNLAPGAPWRHQLDSALRDSVVVLCVIGHSWDPRTLWDRHDYVRREISLSLSERKSLIPLLFDGAHLPRPADLPDDCRAMLDYQVMSFDQWDRAAYEQKIQYLPAVIERTIRVMYEADDPRATSHIEINGTFWVDSLKVYVDDKLAYEKRSGVDSVLIRVQVGIRRIKLTYKRDSPVHPAVTLRSTSTLSEVHGFLESGTYVVNISRPEKWWQFWIDHVVEPMKKVR